MSENRLPDADIHFDRSFVGSSAILRRGLGSNIHISSSARPTLYVCLSPFVINDYSLSISAP